jgi:hypothetical protein
LFSAQSALECGGLPRWIGACRHSAAASLLAGARRQTYGRESGSKLPYSKNGGVKPPLLSKLLFSNNAVAFPDEDQLIGFDIVEQLDETQWPADFNQIRLPGLAESEVKSEIVL